MHPASDQEKFFKKFISKSDGFDFSNLTDDILKLAATFVPVVVILHSDDVAVNSNVLVPAVVNS